jgi:aspartate/methionine/tyrosine aminotransferase
MKKLSDASHQLEGQKMFQILEIANELKAKGRNILHFELGDPDFNTPVCVASAGVNAILEGNTHYAPSGGLKELKEAAQEVTLRSRGFKPHLDQLLVTAGANVQVYYAIACTVNPGDEVIVPDPGFVSYFSILKFIGAKIIRIPLKEENGFRLNPEDVEKAITPKTRLIIMNSPSNPTGSVMTQQEVSDMYQIARVNDLYLISDEIYARMVYEARHYSPSKWDSCFHRVIMVNGFSKSYAMTGWRLGVCTGPPEVIEKMRLLLETTSSCVSPFIQKAGIEALKGSQVETMDMIQTFRERRDLMVDGLNSLPGITCSKPQGAFYVFPNITGTGMSSDLFAECMISHADVALAPGTIFGEHGEGFIRMSYANSSKEIIKKAIEKMRYAL